MTSVIKAKKSAKKRVTLHEHRYSESACTSQVLAKGKGKQTPSWPLIPQASGTCSLSSLEAPKGAIFASSGRDHTLLDREIRPRSCTGREARKDGFDRFRALSFLGGGCLSSYAAHCLHFFCDFKKCKAWPVAQTSPWKSSCSLFIYRALFFKATGRTRYSCPLAFDAPCF